MYQSIESHPDVLSKRGAAKYFFPTLDHRAGWLKLKVLFEDDPVVGHIFHRRRHYLTVSEFKYLRECI